MFIKSIPTTYKRCRFRSRLEASWAAFFDLCEWRWSYEPYELPGWVPDFELHGKNGDRILVEVKPVDLSVWREARSIVQWRSR